MVYGGCVPEWGFRRCLHLRWSGIIRNSAVLTISLLQHLTNQYTITKKGCKIHGLKGVPARFNTLTQKWVNLKKRCTFSTQSQGGYESSKASIPNIFQEQVRSESWLIFLSSKQTQQHLSSVKKSLLAHTQDKRDRWIWILIIK